MSNLYFRQFPKVVRDGITTVNLLKRVRIRSKIFNDASSFYPYVIELNERPEHVAYNYYDDPHLTWLVMLCNDIIDPYFDWYLNPDEFQNFITKKYGSVAEAQATVKHYKNVNDNHIVSRDTFETGAAADLSGLASGDYVQVDAYTFEDELNESKKFIRLIDKSLVPKITKELRLLMNDK